MWPSARLASCLVLATVSATAQIRIVGYAGGDGGRPFTCDDPDGLAVTSVQVFHGVFVDGLEVRYANAAGQPFRGTLIGRASGTWDVFRLEPGEYIAAIAGRAGLVVDSIRFLTNRGRSSPWYGGRGGNPYEFEAPEGTEVIGFVGRVGGGLNQIGIAYRPRQAKLVAKSRPERAPAPASKMALQPDTAYSAGFAGGQGGQPFTYTDATGLTLSAVRVSWGGVVNALQIEFKDSAGTTVRGRGSGHANGNTHVFALEDGEYITAIAGRAGMMVDSIRFLTNRGRSSPWYGGQGGEPYEIHAPAGTEVIGFTGRAGAALDQVGIVYRIRKSP
ncbi:MAG: jacalin-like lectin [Bryobacteraceae bacterium]